MLSKKYFLSVPPWHCLYLQAKEWWGVQGAV
jgi:hypothetical protein